MNLYGFVGNDGVDNLDAFGMITKKLLLIAGPELADRDIPWKIGDETNAEVLYQFHYFYGSPLRQNSGLYQITHHSLSFTASNELLAGQVDAGKKQWEARAGRKCCVDFESRLVTGTNARPMTAGRINELLDGEYDKAILEIHSGSNDQKEFALYLAIGTATKPYEIEGQVNHVCFVEGLALFQHKWFLYYGTADSRIAVAVKNGDH